ncbi:MAG: hypothetical protein LLF96_04350 [Eubacteriales bacterium]|nr:hypothetical protein [Eubacteriales bacterium]
MAIPVDVQAVERVLRPWLGSMLLSAMPLVGDIADIMREYAPYKQTFAQLKEAVEHVLFTDLSHATGGGMCIVLDDYSTRRLKLKDMQSITDDVMGLVFDSLNPFSANFVRLNDYALHEESLSALRVLYQKYHAFFTEEQFTFLVQMIRKIYPPERYEAWLKEPHSSAAPAEGR